MKALFTALLCLAAAPAFAESPYPGPYVHKNVGSNACLVTSSYVTLFDRGQVVSTRNISIDQKAFEANVAAASASYSWEISLHIIETIPNVTISAGALGLGISSFLLFQDASTISTLKGPAAEALRALVATHCGEMR